MKRIFICLALANIAVFAFFKFMSPEVTANSPVLPSGQTVPGHPKLWLVGEPGYKAAQAELREAAARAQIEAPPQENVEVAVNQASAAAEAVPEKPEPKYGYDPSGQPLCSLVGPFDRLLSAEYFLENVNAQGLLGEIKNVVVSKVSGYWLYLAPEPSRKAALRRLSELQRRGIDSYVIPSGSLTNGISLGMFSKQDRATSMQEQIQRQGYNPLISEVPKEETEIWVFLPHGEAGKLSDERWSELLSSSQYLQKRQNLCSDVASR